MSSFKNKINNKKKKKQESIILNELIDLKKQMKEQFEAGKYVDAMDTMAQIAERKKMDPEVMFMGATCYFMTGDSKRAANWINNTLSYDPQHVGARILLGRLCFTQDKLDNGFDVLNYVVENQQAALNDKDKTHLLEILEYCNGNMPEYMGKYPALVEYFKENYVPPTTKASRVSQAEQDNIPSPVVAEDTLADGRAKARAAVDRLKSLLNKSKGAKADSGAVQEPVAAVPVAEKQVSGESPAEIIARVMQTSDSLQEKIRSLNNLAGGMYINDDYEGAFALLKQALEIDANNPAVLKNMAYVTLAMQDRDKAMKYASEMPMMDFAVLRSVKGKCHG